MIFNSLCCELREAPCCRQGQRLNVGEYLYQIFTRFHTFTKEVLRSHWLMPKATMAIGGKARKGHSPGESADASLTRRRQSKPALTDPRDTDTCSRQFPAVFNSTGAA